ncbi:MAG: hypothetical protein JO202_04590 [Ktedonobacteraceae bacterium]|nr:hypothetical protein [Ktedonobacteraceae bacterium]
MPKSVNLCNKTVDRENAYEVWQSPDGKWTWYVLKKYQTPEREEHNPYAKWYCNVVSPMTKDRGETGDCYVYEIKEQAKKLDYNPLSIEWEKQFPIANVNRADLPDLGFTDEQIAIFFTDEVMEKIAEKMQLSYHVRDFFWKDFKEALRAVPDLPPLAKDDKATDGHE